MRGRLFKGLKEVLDRQQVRKMFRGGEWCLFDVSLPGPMPRMASMQGDLSAGGQQEDSVST